MYTYMHVHVQTVHVKTAMYTYMHVHVQMADVHASHVHVQTAHVHAPHVHRAYHMYVHMQIRQHNCCLACEIIQ